MADGYDRFDGDGGGRGGSFVMGLLTGTVLGAGLGMLFAPKTGSELRTQLSGQAENLANQAGNLVNQAGSLANQAGNLASDGVRQVGNVASEWAEKGREKGRDVYDRTREAVSRGTDEAQRYVRETTSPPMPATGTGPMPGAGSEPRRSS